MVELIVKYKRTRYEKFWKIKSMEATDVGYYLNELYRKTDMDKLILNIERVKFDSREKKK